MIETLFAAAQQVSSEPALTETTISIHELLVYAIIALLGGNKSLNAFRSFQAKRNGKPLQNSGNPGNPSHEVMETKIDMLTETCNRVEKDLRSHTRWARERGLSVGKSLSRLGERIARIEGMRNSRPRDEDDSQT